VKPQALYMLTVRIGRSAKPQICDRSYGCSTQLDIWWDCRLWRQLRLGAVWINGKAIIILNDHPEIRRIFDGFQIESIVAAEVLISGSGLSKAWITQRIRPGCSDIKDYGVW